MADDQNVEPKAADPVDAAKPVEPEVDEVREALKRQWPSWNWEKRG